MLDYLPPVPIGLDFLLIVGVISWLVWYFAPGFFFATVERINRSLGDAWHSLRKAIK